MCVCVCVYRRDVCAFFFCFFFDVYNLFCVFMDVRQRSFSKTKSICISIIIIIIIKDMWWLVG